MLDIYVNGVNLTAGKGSQLVLTAPSSMIYSTEPTSEAKQGVEGDVRTIDIGDEFGVRGVKIEALSPLIRVQPVSGIVHLTYQGWVGYALASLVALTIGLGRDRFKSAISAAISRRKEKSDRDPHRENKFGYPPMSKPKRRARWVAGRKPPQV